MESTKVKESRRKKVQKIELDGDPHGDPIQIRKDMTRDKYLEALGFTVLRFENRFVFQEPEIVLNEIKNVFRKRLSFDK